MWLMLRYSSMIITFEGGSAQLKDLTEGLIRFAAARLMSRKLIDKLIVDVEFSKKLLKEDGLLAEMDFDDRNHSPREFTLTVDCTVPLRRIMESVAHEMVHVKQYATGQMVEMYRTKQIKWNKRKFKQEQFPYWDRPWEIEAHGKELGLFVQWAEHSGLASQSWTQEQYFHK